MTTPYSGARRLAIAAGSAATGGALAVLLADPITTGAWRLEHGLLPIIVGITIAAGHLSGAALRQWRLLPAVGFANIFALGTSLTVYSSVGAQKSSSSARAATAAASHNRMLADKRSDLERARQRFEQASIMADREMTGSTCGRRCNDWKHRAGEVTARIKELEAEVASLGADQVAPSRARPFAEAMALLGFDRATVELLAATLEPFAFSLLFELTAIVAFGFAFAAGNRWPAPQPARQVAATVQATVAEWVAAAPALVQPSTVATAGPSGQHVRGNGDNCCRVLAARPVATRAAAEADVVRLVVRGERPPSQEALARRWGVHKGTASKWLADFERRGLVVRTIVGRTKAVSVASSQSIA